MNFSGERSQRSRISVSVRKMAIVVLSFALALAGATFSFAAEKTTDQLLNEARAAVKNLPVDEVKKIIDGKQEYMILDIRDMRGFVVEHLPGSQNLSRAANLAPKLLEHHMQKVAPDKKTKIIVYCEFDLRAPLAVKAMNEVGYSNAVYMLGGLKAWKDAGYPLVK
jgi:rhodanese-related sulfurtransferase